MLVGTRDASGKFHRIGYGICSNENAAAHAHVFKCLKDEAELLVHEAAQESQWFWDDCPTYRPQFL